MNLAKKKIPVSHPVFRGNERLYVDQCLETEWISSIGEFIPRFEDAFARFCGVTHAVACNSGTSALHLALMAFDIGPGDEVIVPTLTYVAVANAVRYCGATPVLVDSEPRTMNLDPDKVAQAVTPKTRGIIVVHLYGHPADMDPLLSIARKHGLFVVEDAAEAHGAAYKGRPAGSLGDIGTFSFFGNKIVTTGEGGMVVTSDAALMSKIRLLKGQGVDPNRRYWFPMVGYNYRMTNIQAAIGLAQMEHVAEHTAAHRQVANWYHTHLAGSRQRITCPVEEAWASHAFWLYTIVLKEDAAHERDDVMRSLDEAGIETRPVFHPMHTLPPYREDNGYPVADMLSRRGISLPTHGLLTEDDISYIAHCLQTACCASIPALTART